MGVDGCQSTLSKTQQYGLTIRGRDSELKVQSLEAHLKPTWNASFICSIKEKALTFTLTDIISGAPLSSGELYFSPIRAQA